MKKLVSILLLMLGIVAAASVAAPWLSSARAQAGPTIKVTGPTNGASVSNPVTVSVQSSGATIKAATDNDPSAAHYHYFIDRDPATVLQPGQPIPQGQPDIIHTPDANLQLPTLAPGPHKVWVVLAHTDHTPYSPNVQDQVSFTVGGAAQAAQGAVPQIPVVGRGGLLPAAEANRGTIPTLERTASQNPWIPILASIAAASMLLAVGLRLARRPAGYR